MKKIFVLIFAILIMLPSYAGVKSFMDKSLNSWVGYSIDDVINSWGKPTGEQKTLKKHFYYWNTSKTAYVQQPSNAYGDINSYAMNYVNGNNAFGSASSAYGEYNVEYYCTKMFEVDADNKIINWQWKGNGCPSGYLSGKELVNPQNDEWARKKKKNNL